jgi:hypothetical protein
MPEGLEEQLTPSRFVDRIAVQANLKDNRPR